MTALMVQGVSSWAGKSFLVTALARALRRRNIDVVPFKAMNMSNNARVVTGGRELGTAQYLQALAAGVEPDVRMNPVLVKPEGETRSQVVLLGKPDLELSRMSWRARARRVWPVIEEALCALLADHELVLIEGGGSPAEINLRDVDLVNMRTARTAGASVLLVADINRGGAFAHLYGTWALLREAERSLVRGFVLNKFRGDRALLTPAPAQLQELTGVPTLGVLPWIEHGLPDEDGAVPSSPSPSVPAVVVVRYPTASNLDEFKPLEQIGALGWARRPAELERAELVVLPGSKHVAADLQWLKHAGLAAAIRARVRAGRSVLGICGGLQMLGRRVRDEAGVDGTAEGLGLLAIETSFAADKQAARISTTFCDLPGAWNALSGRRLVGYEIRHGISTPRATVAAALPDGLGFVDGPVLGIYVHGLFEDPGVSTALLGVAPPISLDQTFEQLADMVEQHLEVDMLLQWAEATR